MAFGHGKDQAVYIHGADLTAFFRSFGSPREVEVADTSAFRDVAKKFIVGLADGTFTGEGLFDGAVGAEDEKLDGLLGGQDKVIAYYPQGDAIGKAGHAGLAQESSYEPTGDIGDAVSFGFEAQASGGIERVISLLAGLTSVVATGAQATQNDGASTANGGAAYLQSLSKVGGTNATVIVQHSSDNFGADITTLASFAAVSAAGVAERVPIVGTIKRYVRAFVTLGGGGTWKFQVGLHRKP